MSFTIARLARLYSKANCQKINPYKISRHTSQNIDFKPFVRAISFSQNDKLIWNQFIYFKSFKSNLDFQLKCVLNKPSFEDYSHQSRKNKNYVSTLFGLTLFGIKFTEDEEEEETDEVKLINMIKRGILATQVNIFLFN